MMKRKQFLWQSALLFVLCLAIAPIQAVWGPPYLYWILMAGPFLFVPWAFELLPNLPQYDFVPLPLIIAVSALCLALSFCLPAGIAAGLLSGIWLITVSLLMMAVWARRSVLPIAAVSAFCFLPIGAAWAVADRLGIQPLGFNPLIVLLTAIHFHYAGFALALITALLPEGVARFRLSKGLLVGVIGVAIGITTTELGLSHWIETIAVSGMVLVGWGIAFCQFKAAQALSDWKAKVLLRFGSLALVGGLLLALLYGWRFQYRWDALTIPQMYATHGVLNSLGFALLSFGGWQLADKATPLAPE